MWKTFDPQGANLDWDVIAAAIPQSGAMKSCIQDAVFHAEGDVWTHTRMVTEQMIANPATAGLSADRRRGLILAAIFHDVAKPATAETIFDPDLARIRVTHHNHSKMGARDAWVNLWKAGVDIETRLQVFSLISWHQRPFHLFKRNDARNDIARFSAVGVWRELIMLARADNHGRISPNSDDTDEILQLLELQCEEEGVLDAEWAFGSPAARTRVCRGDNDSLFFTPQEPVGSQVIVMSAPPGSGKDTYIQRVLGDVPMISLDQVRGELDLAADKNQGRVIQAAYEKARDHLRRKAPFVWNATGMSKMMRDKIVGLALQYDAHVEIHALDCPHELMLKQNRERQASVPESAIADMLLKWEPPMAGEAHAVKWIDARTFDLVHRPEMPSASAPQAQIRT